MIVNDNEIAEEGRKRIEFRNSLNYWFWLLLMRYATMFVDGHDVKTRFSTKDGFGDPFSYITDPQTNISVLCGILGNKIEIQPKCVSRFVESYFKYTNSWICTSSWGFGDGTNCAYLSLGGSYYAISSIKDKKPMHMRALSFNEVLRLLSKPHGDVDYHAYTYNNG